MYAIVRTGGKQYRVKPGETLQVEKLNAQVGSEVVLDQVLLVSDGERVQVGRPLVEGVQVKAEVLRHGRGPKLIVFKKKRRKNYRRKAGHRQWFTELKIQDIVSGG